MAETLKYDFANNPTLEAQTGPTLGITRASTASVTDYDNIIRTVQAAEARFTGGRRVENLVIQSGDLEDAGWTKSNATVTAGISDPDGGTTAFTVTATGATGQVYDTITLPKVGLSLNNSMWIRRRTGSGVIAMHDGNSFGWRDVTASVTTEWTRVSAIPATYPRNSTTTYCGVQITTSGDEVDVWHPQCEVVSGQDDPSPSEYQATTTAPVANWYATKRRTNLVLQSQDISTTWTSFRLTKTTDDNTDPIGGSTADTMTHTGTGDGLLRQTLTISPVTTYTFSAYLKVSVNSTNPMMQLHDGTNGQKVWFNLSTGAVGTEQALGSGWGTIESGIEDAGNGWYRCWVSGTSLAATTGFADIFLSTTDGSLVESNGDALNVWGAQLEKGSTATDYVATTTAVASSDFDTAITTTGLLVEEARTNICLQSEDFGTTWLAGTVDSVVNTDQTVSPDGATTADQLIDDAGDSGLVNVRFDQNLTWAIDTVFTVSVYAKADQLDWLRVEVAALGALSLIAHYDLTNGVVGATVGADVTSTFITDVGNGWYRCGFTFTSDAADTGAALRLWVAEADNDVVVDSDGTSSIFVWGAQIEAGSFPLSYIPTTTVSVSRAADDISTADVSWLDNAATAVGSYYVKVSSPVSDTSQRRVFQTGTTTNLIDIRFPNNTPVGSSFNTVGDNASTSGTQVGVGVATQAVVGYSDDNFKLYQDGVDEGVDTTASFPLPADAIELRIGARIVNNFFLNGHIAEIRYWDERLDNATLLDYSTNGPPTAFPGSIAGDGAHIWPPRANDPRWVQIITDSGITTSGNFIDDVHAALEALASTTGQLDDLWKKTKTVYSITDTSEPYLY